MNRYFDGSYRRSNPSWHVEDSKWKADKVTTLLAKNNINPTSFVDIGCGVGAVIGFLVDFYPAATFVGYEMSPDAFRLCISDNDRRIRFVNDQKPSSRNRFDVALCLDVLEHVNDYFGFLESIKPTADFFVFHIPLDVSLYTVSRRSFRVAREESGHLHFFTKEIILDSLVDCHYDVLDFHITESFSQAPHKSVAQKALNLLRTISYRIAPSFTATSFGHCSLLVLAR